MFVYLKTFKCRFQNVITSTMPHCRSGSTLNLKSLEKNRIETSSVKPYSLGGTHTNKGHKKKNHQLDILSRVGFEPTPQIGDQNNHPVKGGIDPWVWRLRPLGHPDFEVIFCFQSLYFFCCSEGVLQFITAVNSFHPALKYTWVRVGSLFPVKKNRCTV